MSAFGGEEMRQLEFLFVGAEMAWKLSPRFYQHAALHPAAWTAHAENFAGLPPDVKVADVSDELTIQEVPQWPAASLKLYWGVVIRVTTQYFNLYGQTAAEIINAYLGENTPDSFLKSLTTSIWTVPNIMAIDIRIVSETEHEHLYAMVEGAEFPQISLTTTNQGDGHFKF